MREIKFRAWDKIDSKMLFFDGIFNRQPFTERSTFPQYESRPELHDLELMQFTGLKDKDEKEIFEGDIVMYRNDYPGGLTEPDEPHNDFAIVEWSSEARWNLDAAFKHNRDTTADWIHDYGDGLEIIGNIHENPELLEGR